jgi:phosphate-selective porin OprO/OprP
MTRLMASGRFHWMCVVTLGWMVTAWPAFAIGQQGSPWVPPITDPPRQVASSSDGHQDLLDRFRQMEQRLDRVTKQNEDLTHENKALAEQVHDLARRIGNPWLQGGMTGAMQGASSSGVTALGDAGTGSFDPADAGMRSGSRDMGGQLDRNGDGSARGAGPTGGGRSLSRAAGGDPTAVGEAQEVGNLHLGKVPLNAYYDFDNAGYHLETADREWSIGVSGMTQLDGVLYGRPTPGAATSGFYNPRSRIYFEGHATQPISWEFSFQNFYDNVALLDAYVNFNYDPRFQVQIGRFKNPFSYEFYRMHIWDLMAPERSLFANNFEANRRFGLMAHGVLFDHFLEYALGSFDSQRNSLRPFNNRQDFEASLNFKPFYDREEGFLLRNLQVGGSVDLGNENESLVPAVLRTNRSPGGDAVDSAGASNAASLPFLAFNPGVLERGTRDLWEAHLAYYYGGLSLVTAVEGGHESYARSATAAPVHVPIDGWFVQAGYLLTGETIRDRTNIQPLRPFDMREGRCGPGAWEVTARYSQLNLDSRVFTAGLADPNLWTNHAKLVDVGCNWYLNQFVKVYFDWEHAIFGSPVFSNTGSFQKSNDLFWIRTQVYF